MAFTLLRESQPADVTAQAVKAPALSLAHAASETSIGNRRATALLDATRHFASLTRPTRENVLAYKEFFYQFIASTAKPDRRTMSATLAGLSSCPRPIALYFSLDDEDIAAPMLLFSPVLNEADLCRFARRLKPRQLQILCRRRDLTEATAKALVEAGGDSCRIALMANPQTAGFASVRPVGAKHEAAAANVDTTPALGARQISTPVAETSAVAAAHLAAIDTATRQLLDLAGRSGRLAKTTQVKADGSQEIPFPRRLIEAARRRDRVALLQTISQKTGIRSETIAGLIDDPQFETLAVLMKGLEIDPVSANQLFLLLRPETGRDRARFTAATGLFKRLDPKTCTDFLTTLRNQEIATPADPAPSKFSEAVAARRREFSADRKVEPSLPQREATPRQQAPAARTRTAAPSFGKRMLRV